MSSPKWAGPAVSATDGEAQLVDRLPGAIDQLNTRKFKRAQARDRRHAAVHEASHIIVARHFGCEVTSAERSWAGRMQWTGFNRISIQARRMIGVAGAVADHLWFGGWIEDFLRDASSMSASDYEVADYRPNEWGDALMEAAADVGELLRRDGSNWYSLIMAEARRLIMEARR
jgi:hypothetical protein